MLSETFLHLMGVGPTLERRLWRSGIRTWEDAFRAETLPAGIMESRFVSEIAQSIEALNTGKLCRLGHMLDSQEHWRSLRFTRDSADTQPRSLAELQAPRILALDIETTGLAPPNDHVTTVGICGHATDFQPWALVVDQPGWADVLADVMRRTDVLLTFNGRQFDVPFLLKSHPTRGLAIPPFHVDLCLLLRRLGLKGGLKRVQVQLGYQREGELADVDGFMAVLLWREYTSGTSGALETLIRYCLEDVVVLLDLACVAYARMSAELSADWPAPLPPRVSLQHLPYNPRLINRLVREMERRGHGRRHYVSPGPASTDSLT